MNETDKKIDDIYREMIRKKTGEERMLMGFSMLQFSTKILLSSVKEKIPDSNLKKYMFLKIYGSDFDSLQIKKILNSF